MDKEKDYRIQSIVDMDEVLGALASSREPMTLSGLVAATGLNKGKVFRVLRTLEEIMYVEVYGDHYKLGLRLALYWARVKSRLKSERDVINKSLEQLED